MRGSIYEREAKKLLENATPSIYFERIPLSKGIKVFIFEKIIEMKGDIMAYKPGCLPVMIEVKKMKNKKGITKQLKRRVKNGCKLIMVKSGSWLYFVHRNNRFIRISLTKFLEEINNSFIPINTPYPVIPIS